MPVQQRRLPRSRALALICVSLPLLAAGCAAAQQVTETPGLEQDGAEVDSLRHENASLRTRVKNLEERVRLLERGGGEGWDSSAVSTTGYDSYSVDPGPETWAEPELDGPRQLPVVKLTPNERSVDRRVAAAAAAQPATAMRSSGSISLSPLPHSGAPEQLGSQYVVDARGGGYDDSAPAGPATVYDDVGGGEPASYRLVGSKLVQATKTRPKTSGRSDRDSGAVKDYKVAMAVYREGRYAEAEQAFASIVGSHPNHDYADNALYWQGEAAYDQAHYADALAAFTKVVERYGGGNKAPDALLKIGLCYGRLGDAANARDVLSQLVAAYPRAEASKIAKRKLADLSD